MREDRAMIKIAPNVFKESFVKNANQIVLKGFTNYSNFQFTDRNKYVINQLYLHLICSPKYEGNLKKNILLTGRHGSGKSTILNAFSMVINQNTRKRVTYTTMESLNELVRKNGIEYFYRRPLIMDELGREEKFIVDYGNKIYPSVHLLGIRYKLGAITWGIGNFSPDDMREIYGMYMYERIREMFDFIELNDNNWRPVNAKKL